VSHVSEFFDDFIGVSRGESAALKASDGVFRRFADFRSIPDGDEVGKNSSHVEIRHTESIIPKMRPNLADFVFVGKCHFSCI